MSINLKIILGSASLGRKSMLEEMGYEFDVMSADIDEKSIRFNDPRQLSLALAKAKAEALKQKISEPAILITADQVILCNGQIYEKPQNEQEVREYLESYNNYPVETYSAVVVTNLKTNQQVSGVDVAKIYFNHLSETDIEQIIKYGNPYKYGGGIMIENELEKSKFKVYVNHIEGTVDSVIGLPKEMTQKLINQVTI